MKIEVNLSEEEFDILEDRASKSNVGISEYVHRAMLEKLEDDEDIEAANVAYKKYLENPVAYSSDEVFARLGV